MKDASVKKVLVLGSGAITIGQAGEFDYSGAQAIKALREEGIECILVNPNIATIQSDPKFVDKAYFLPVTWEFVEKIIEKERPDGILLGFGGQTALNCGMELHEHGILEKYGVKILGTGIESIIMASDREEFQKLMQKHGVPIPKSTKATTIKEAIESANSIGYPVMVRVAYTLGGEGTGVARSENELMEIASRGLTYSRIHQILIEEYLDKWKELEYEVMRDCDGNSIIICNMENLDPMGIHTGDSIVVAPSQTLTNKEYHRLRDLSLRIINALGIVGECNVQFAVKGSEIRVIEVNSRLSRSSALASKATGYPIAYIAAKLSIGHTLHELTNKITSVTSAFFEPSMDYVVVKIPRWDFQKFPRANRRVGTQMKSVGEVMAIGRTFEEALQKAVRMLDVGRELTDDIDGNFLEELKIPTDRRLFFVAKAARTMAADDISSITGIDKWFLSKIRNIVDAQENMTLTKENLFRLKQLGFSDTKLANLTGKSEMDIRALRTSLGVTPVVKQIDTLAAEWPAMTNYLYLTYDGEDDIEFSDKEKSIVLGSGCYRIGSSVEFDWCCVNMALELRKKAEVIMVNYNPETVSTDYDVLDKLYFEELSFERVLDIIEKEKNSSVVVSVGGQMPNNLALRLSKHARILGTDAKQIDVAEDRHKFSKLLDTLNIMQPLWDKFESIEHAKTFAAKIGYPVLIRPSYVLSGSAMNVVFDENQLEKYLQEAVHMSKEHPVVMSKFISDAREVEVDAVCDGKNIFIGAIAEHVENAGTHSGDATLVIPTFSISDLAKNKIREYTRKIARRLAINGPFNIQYIVKGDEISVIECNLRASRSMPFVSKTMGINMMKISASAMAGEQIIDGEASAHKYSIKSPKFSFMRLEGADPITHVEMASTGEVACFGKTFEEAFLKSIIAAGTSVPEKGAILVTVGDKKGIVPAAKRLAMQYKIYATEHTAEELCNNGVPCEVLHKVTESEKPNILDYITNRELKLVVNIPSTDDRAYEDEYLIRRKAVEFGIPVITNMELLEKFVNAVAHPLDINNMIDFESQKAEIQKSLR